MSLDAVRREIDGLDDQLVALLAARQAQVMRAAELKRSADHVRSPDRRAQVIDRVCALADRQGLDPEVAERVWTAVIDAFIDLELRHHAIAGPTEAARSGSRRHRVSSGSPYEQTIGFSRAIRADNRVLVSGTGPVWPDSSCPDDARVQARRCFEIIEGALRTVGATWSDVVRTRMFITDPDAAEPVGAVHGELFADIRPAATMVVVAGLLDPRWKVEIEVEAELADRTEGGNES